MDRLAGRTPRSSSDRSATPGAGTRPERPKPEDAFEILCNDVVLPLDATLAAVRQYIWRQSGELVMYYRRKVGSPSSRSHSRNGTR